jgi:anti-sigma B factor antagonist
LGESGGELRVPNRPETAATAPPVVRLAVEIDMTNCSHVGIDLAAAYGPGVKVVIADMTRTTFCDSSAVRALLQAQKLATSHGIELRLVVISQAVLRIFELTGVAPMLRLYPALEAALAA